MDLITQIINAKSETDSAKILQTTASDLVKYSKLRKLPNFDPSTIPSLQNADTDPVILYYVLTLADILADLDLDFATAVKDLFPLTRKRKRELIIGSSSKKLVHKDFATLTPTEFDQLDPLAVITQHNESLTKFVIVCTNFDIYSGSCQTGNITVSDKFVPFVYNGVTISLYSPQGNNDFVFARLGNYSISMPNNKQIQFTHNSESKLYDLTTSDQQKLALSRGLETVAQLILKAADELHLTY